MLVNQDGIVNQKLPTLRFLDIALEQDGMTLSLKGGSVQLILPILKRAERSSVSAGRLPVSTRLNRSIDGCLKLLGSRCRWFGQSRRVPTVGGNAVLGVHNTSQSAFVDIAPLLIVSLESLADLNGRLSNEGKRAVAIEQFRPNVVIEGVDAFAEESAKRLEIGALGLTQLLPCERCSVTTFDVSTESDSEAKPSKEPLKTLSQYRNGGVGYAGGVTLGLLCA